MLNHYRLLNWKTNLDKNKYETNLNAEVVNSGRQRCALVLQARDSSDQIFTLRTNSL
jgi:hypothetical protein